MIDKAKLLEYQKKYKKPMKIFKELYIEQQLAGYMVQSIKERDEQMGDAGRNYRGYVEGLFRYKQNSANEITKTITGFIDFMGGLGERISSAGRYVPGEKYENMDGKKFETKGRFIPSTTRAGTSDISATIYGKTIKIEVKYGKDRLSKKQKDYLTKAHNAGCFCYVAKDFDGFFDFFMEKIIE